MFTQSRALLRIDFRTLKDIFLTGLGILLGGIMAILSLWLWLDFRTNHLDSHLTQASTQLVAIIPNPARELLVTQAQLMALPLAGHTSAFWYMSRAGGFVAYLLLWFSIIWGLTLSTKITAGIVSAPTAYGLHEFLSILAVVFAVIHSGVLLGDEYIKFSIFQLTIPFTGQYEPLWTGLGTIGLYLLVALTGSFYVRKQIGHKLWRFLHYLSLVAYLIALSHGLMAGSDSGLTVVKIMYLGTGLSVLFLTYYRLLSLRVKR
jgi:predicted ferric reductase